MTINVLSTVFLSKYDFTGISSVLGIIVILKNKISACSLDGAAFLPVVLGILSKLMGSRMLKSTDRFNSLCHSFWKLCDWERS